VVGEVTTPAGWTGAVELRGGGRLDTQAFMDGSREFFENAGNYRRGEVPMTEILPGEIRCEGAFGLMDGRYGPSRCAKGEILTVRAEGWSGTAIRIGAGGWLVPLGGGVFKAGSTYEWDDLDELPTAKGRARVEEIAARLGGESFEVIGHDAGVRPIMRRSEPLIGPIENGAWMFNGLGSKGSLYAPGMAARLADWLVHGREPETEVDFREFSKFNNKHTHDDGPR
jgi:glycine/D-amino acid oxidase-like deaminating enzyme